MSAACDAVRSSRRTAFAPRTPRAQLKMHPFAAEKAFAQAANFSAEELGDALVRLAELDAAAKGGSRLPADLELERALVDVTRGRASNT